MASYQIHFLHQTQQINIILLIDVNLSAVSLFRYNTHPKLTNFMAPLKKGTMSDVSRNDLFASLFGDGI